MPTILGVEIFKKNEVKKDATLIPQHYAFLGNGTDGPRKVFIQQMIADFSDTGAILADYIPVKANAKNN